MLFPILEKEVVSSFEYKYKMAWMLKKKVMIYLTYQAMLVGEVIG